VCKICWWVVINGAYYPKGCVRRVRSLQPTRAPPRSSAAMPHRAVCAEALRVGVPAVPSTTRIARPSPTTRMSVITSGRSRSPRSAFPSRRGVAVAAGGNNPFDATSGAAKRAADTVTDKAKTFWNDEVLGAKKAMERDASKKPGSDVRASVDVTLEQSVLGADVSLTYSRKRICPTCFGAGRLPQTFIDCDTCEGNEGVVDERTTVKVTVPKGVTNGSTLRLKDQGDAGTPDGQLYVEVRAASMNEGGLISRCEEHDLITRGVVARFPDANSKTSVRVRMIEGDWGNLVVPVNAKVGQALRVKGRGAPKSPGSDERGDHLFVIGKVVYEDENKPH